MSGQQTAGPSAVLAGVVTAITPDGTQTVVSLLVDPAVPAVEQLASPVLVLLDPSGTDVP